MLKKIICLLSLLLCCDYAYASNEQYTVEVNVDVTDESASKAQEKAMSEANRAAIMAVAKHMTTSDGVRKLQQLDDNQLVNFVKEVSVVDEKTSAIRYMARLKILLNEDMLKQYMNEREIPVVLQLDSKIIVIPVYREFDSAKPQLWETTNLWKNAWENSQTSGKVKVVLIPNDAEHYALIDAEKALEMNKEALSKIMELNHAQDVYVLSAAYDGIEGLIVKAGSYGGDNLIINTEGSRSSGMELLERAVEKVKAALENRVMEKNIDTGAKENSVVVLYQFEHMTDWIKTEQALSNIEQITRIETDAMGAKTVQFKLFFVSSFEQLNFALRRKNLKLGKQANYYLLQKK